MVLRAQKELEVMNRGVESRDGERMKLDILPTKSWLDLRFGLWFLLDCCSLLVSLFGIGEWRLMGNGRWKRDVAFSWLIVGGAALANPCHLFHAAAGPALEH
jgi:hypothetical protein